MPSVNNIYLLSKLKAVNVCVHFFLLAYQVTPRSAALSLITVLIGIGVTLLIKIIAAKIFTKDSTGALFNLQIKNSSIRPFITMNIHN